MIKKPILNKFNKFLLGGGINFLLKIIFTFILTELLHVWYFISYVITLMLLILFSFFYNVYITFRVKSNKKQNFIKYCFVLFVFSMLDAISVKILTDILQFYYIVSIVFVTLIIFVLKFFMFNWFVFKKDIKKNIPGNFYNKYESKNFLVKVLIKKYFKTLFRIIEGNKPREILDIGCGEGQVTSRIKERFKSIKVEGSDLEKSIIEKARISKNIKFSVESVYKLKRKSNSFDIVIVLEVLEHLENPGKAIREAKRVSKRYCLFSVPYEPFWRMANIARLAYLSRLGNTPGHIQHWTKKGFEKMLKKHFKSVIIKRAGLWNFALCSD